MNAYRRNCRKVVWYNGPRQKETEVLAILLPFSLWTGIIYIFSLYISF